jgi:prepilin-type N-terminal cleavage/methylation domain-containing protein
MLLVGTHKKGNFMKKNGFTFIELLVVMALFALISLIVIPSITGLVKQAKENKKKAFENDVFLATEAYIQNNIDDYPELSEEGGTTTITLEQLFLGNYIKSTLVNPNYCDEDNNCIAKRICTPKSDDEDSCEIDDYKINVTTTEDGTYNYELIEP